MSFKADFNAAMSKAGLTSVGLIIGILAFVISGTWVVFIPIACILIIYYLIKDYVENGFYAALISYYVTSVAMSVMGILIFYFPNTIGGGLFEAGYVLADFFTLNSIIDWIIKIQTDSWGIIYNWVVVSSAIIITAILVFRANREH